LRLHLASFAVKSGLPQSTLRKDAKDAEKKREVALPAITTLADKETKLMLKVGDMAPDFELKSHLDNDRTVKLSDLRGQNVVIAFYAFDWTGV